MFRKKIEKSIIQAVEKTFLDMLFIDIAKIFDMDKNADFSSVLSISFINPVKGEMVLSLPFETKKMILENIHGVNWESLTPQAIDDCLLEVLNVLGGNFLNYFSGDNKKHNMSFPKIITDKNKELPEDEETIRCFFNGENVPFCVTVSIWEQEQSL